MKPQKFTIPRNIESITNQDRRVVIVSVFGKSQYKTKACKAEMFSSVLQTDLLDGTIVGEDSLCEIEGYHDIKTRTIYLHLKGLFDTNVLINEYDKFVEKQKRKDFFSAWAHMRNKYSRALLVLFHLSHIVILSHPTHTFDYSYIHLFRALDIVRQKTLIQLSDLLNTISGLPKNWIYHCRPCSPRVLFYFETCPPIFCDPDSGANIKKLEHSLEDKIYQVLRKHRIVTNISMNSLFAIPANQEFVFVNTGNNDTRDILEYMTQQLIKSCTVDTGSRDKKKNNVDSTSRNEFESESSNFKKFLQQHVNLAFSKGFDDNVGRQQVLPHFEIPTVSLFFEVANKLYEFFVDGTDKELSNLHGLLNTDVKFSKSRCTKVLPRALQAYQDNLPQYYTKDFHESKLALAMSVFEMHARGPLFEEFSEKLQEECEKYWRAGRQMCQVLSLTGNPCTNAIHTGGGEGAGGGSNEPLDKREDFFELSHMEHCSGVRYVCACNCGRSQGSREDPFKLKQANYDYFHMMSMQCNCNLLESFRFPVFQPSIHNYRAAQFPVNRKNSLIKTDVSTPFSLGANDEITGSGGQSPQAPNDHEEEEEEEEEETTAARLTSDENKVVIAAVTELDEKNSKEKAIKRQPSTTEYLPGMLHTESPVGLLPQFSSWSLVCLGSSSIYSHNLGLQHQSGVLASSAYLLPWDVTVRLEHQKERSSLWSSSSGDGNQQTFGSRGKNFQNINNVMRGGRKAKKGKELLVKIFVGVEYECPRGHRFMLATPDKVLKATGVGTVKDNGNKVSTNDMPLYFPCPCRQPKPLIAQLMRIHVVTPKAPVHVTLNPRVQPGPSPCSIFVTGCEEPIKLSQSAYWILRLPYVYMGEKGPYLPPKEPVNYGKLLAGMYGISEVVSDKK